MKAARIGFIVFGIVLLMFVIAPYVSAQAIEGEWFKGKASMKGYKISSDGALLGKVSGSKTIYVNIVDGDNLEPPVANQYLVTTCWEDPDVKGVWNLANQQAISKDNIYGDPNAAMIWDFADDSLMEFYHDVLAFPMFYVKINGSLTKANFKSFSCQLWDYAEGPNVEIGSCSITFKNIDPLKVPRGTTGCIVTAP